MEMLQTAEAALVPSTGMFGGGGGGAGGSEDAGAAWVPYLRLFVRDLEFKLWIEKANIRVLMRD